MSDQQPLVLASGSPRRRELLGLLGLTCIIDPSGADETPPAGATPETTVQSLALVLRLLRGRTHRVPTGVALIAPDGAETVFVETATVTMHPYTEVAIGAYLSTGEPFDKAGSYAVQGAGGALVAAVEGCYTAVVGLPLCRVAARLRDAGFAVNADLTAGCTPGHSCVLNPRGT
ncbi:MAG: Maf family protein [Thermomicrobia bacterium]|nr:Maf family protein [Thermomicrobia bacterium]